MSIVSWVNHSGFVCCNTIRVLVLLLSVCHYAEMFLLPFWSFISIHLPFYSNVICPFSRSVVRFLFWTSTLVELGRLFIQLDEKITTMGSWILPTYFLKSSLVGCYRVVLSAFWNVTLQKLQWWTVGAGLPTEQNFIFPLMENSSIPLLRTGVSNCTTRIEIGMLETSTHRLKGSKIRIRKQRRRCWSE